MKYSDTVSRLINLLDSLVDDVNGFTEKTALIGDAGLESIQVIEYLCEVEDEFDMVIDEEALSYVNTIGDLADTILKISYEKST
jgi:acyl carrier protein